MLGCADARATLQKVCGSENDRETPPWLSEPWQGYMVFFAERTCAVAAGSLRGPSVFLKIRGVPEVVADLSSSLQDPTIEWQRLCY